MAADRCRQKPSGLDWHAEDRSTSTIMAEGDKLEHQCLVSVCPLLDLTQRDQSKKKQILYWTGEILF